jgi:hypothetical protein
MPLNRHPPKRGARWLGIAALVLAFVGYRVYAIRRGDALEPHAPGSPTPAGSAALPADAGPPRHLPLDPAVRRKMRLAPRRGAAFALAFGKGRLGQVTEDALTVRDTSTYRVKLKLGLEKPRAVTALADGSLFCPGGRQTLRLLWHDDKPRVYPPMPLLPGSQVFGDRVDPDRVWSVSASGKTLFGYDLVKKEGELLGPTELIELEGFDRHALTSIRDGSFVYSTESGFSRFHGTGKKEPVQANSTDVFRILPGSRPDTMWLLRLDRRASLHGLVGGKLARLETVNLEADPFDAESAGGLLAVLELDQPSDAPWTFVLEVFDVSGKRKFREALPAIETLGEDWVERLTENRGLAVSADPPAVAIGGPTALTVFDARNGTKVFAEP